MIIAANAAQPACISRLTANSNWEAGAEMSVGRATAHGKAAVSGATVLFGLLTAYSVHADPPIAPPKCSLSLSVEVTPDVPNPGNGAFISSLLGNHTEYQLFLLSVADDTHVNLRLQGPGPDERCQAVVDSMRSDGRVQSIETS
jgi:hypothetical protein